MQWGRTNSSLILQNGRVRINYSSFVFICAQFFNMPHENIIQVVYPVSGKIRDLSERTDEPHFPNGKRWRRFWMQATGTVIYALGHRRWQVQLDSNKNVLSVASTALKVIGNEEGLHIVRINYYLFCRL